MLLILFYHHLMSRLCFTVRFYIFPVIFRQPRKQVSFQKPHVLSINVSVLCIRLSCYNTVTHELKNDNSHLQTFITSPVYNANFMQIHLNRFLLLSLNNSFKTCFCCDMGYKNRRFEEFSIHNSVIKTMYFFVLILYIQCTLCCILKNSLEGDFRKILEKKNI